MQAIIYAKISEGDLLIIFGIGKNRLERWKNAGLPDGQDGRFSLSEICRWLQQSHRELERQIINKDKIDQQQLVELLGKSRQWITFVEKHRGLPRSASGNYSLKKVCRWVMNYYRDMHAKKYKKAVKSIRDKIEDKTKRLLMLISK